MWHQGTWMKREGEWENIITWDDIWYAEPQGMQFVLRAVYDMLPCPESLLICDKRKHPTCLLHPGESTLHIYNSYP